MIKLSKTQKEIEVLAKRVPLLTEEQKEWARKQFNYYRVVRQGTTETRCPECAGVVSVYDNAGRRKGSKWCKSDYTIVCPHCGAKIQLRVVPADCSIGKGWNKHQEDFFQVMNVVGDWQVTRLIYMQKYTYVRKENTPWEYYEVCQAWNNPAYKKTFFRSFPKGMQMHHPLNPYQLNRCVIKRDENGDYVKDEKGYYVCESEPNELEPRMAGGSNYFDTTAICPNAKILPAFRQRGIDRKLFDRLGRNAMWLFESVSQGKPMYETLLKAKEYKLFKSITENYNKDKAEPMFSAWKICQRRHYDIHSNFTEWHDYVSMLIDEKKDIRNPYYVCPSDLHKAHQDMLDIKRKREEKEEERRRREQQERDRIAAEKAMKDAIKTEKQYIKDHKQFFDINIPTNKGFTIVVLKTINEFKEEGLTLDHCVFRMGYYRKKNSLILSARDEDNKPIETIEVDIPTLRIVQCYGKHDTFTPMHKDIVNTMTANLWQVEQRRVQAC